MTFPEGVEETIRDGADQLYGRRGITMPAIPPLSGLITPLSVSAMQMYHFAREDVHVIRTEWDDFRAFPDMRYNVDMLAEHVDFARTNMKESNIVRLGYAAVSRLQYEHNAIWFEFFFTGLGKRMVKELIRGFVWDFDNREISMKSTIDYWTTRIRLARTRDDDVFLHVKQMRDPRLEPLKAEAFHHMLKIWTPETSE